MFLLHHCFAALKVVPLTIICLLAILIPLWVHDFFIIQIHKRTSTGLSVPRGQTNRQRIVIKLIGFYTTLLLILLAYNLFAPVYQYSASATIFYNHFFYLLDLMAPFILVLGFFYFIEIDRRQENPCDAYWHMGCFVTGQWKKVNAVILKEHARVWFIKAFFTPFMFASLVQYVQEFISFNWKDISFFSFHNYLLNLCYSVDILYGVLGYILTFRLLDTHIRSTEPTCLGWLTCLACYHPLASIFGINRFPYDDGFNWNHWFALTPGLYYISASVILFLTVVYALATVAFGYRMSNLTYRGIITSGPYRFTKHPAYLCKVASWWLIYLPFFSVDGPLLALKHTANLSIISLIYYLRARTEENHLSNYPEYVAYANWINERGLFRFISRRFPALKYSEEKCKRWHSVVWFKKLH